MEIKQDRIVNVSGFELPIEFLVLAPENTTRKLISTQDADDSVVLLDEYQLGIKNLRPWKQ
jgi:hypothetical protein